MSFSRISLNTAGPNFTPLTAVTVGKYLLDKARTNPGKTLGYSVAAGTAIVGPVMLPLVGFSAIGPVSGMHVRMPPHHHP